jgi:hypothetical protein
MDYYDKKRNAYKLVDEMLSEGKSIEQIHFKVSTIFGFGIKFVTERVKILECILKEKKTLE